MGGVAVEPAHVALVDGLGVVADRAVVAAVGPAVRQGRRQLDQLGDLGARQSLVGHPQRLVVQVRPHVALPGQVGRRCGVAPGGPVVGGERDLGPVVQHDRLAQVVRPDAGVAHDRAAQGQDVVHVVGGVLRHAQGAPVGEVEVHLRGRLGVRRHLEDDPHSVGPRWRRRSGSA